MLQYNNNKSFIWNFFNLAFDRNPESDSGYFQDWKHRAKKPLIRFIGYMDNYRRLMFAKVVLTILFKYRLPETHLREIEEYAKELADKR